MATINDNLGANEVANAVVFPEINTILQAASFNGYDVLHADIRMGCNAATITGGSCVPGSPLKNGFEQIFIGHLATTPGPPGGGLPEPQSLLLFGIALAALGFMTRARLKV